MRYMLFLLLFLFEAVSAQEKSLSDGFVYLDEKIPGIVYDIRYAGSNNFIGKPVSGYHKPQAILSEPAADALLKVQEELIQKDLMLKIFDAYRPQQAVDHFIRWARDKEDTLMKAQFYPDIPKSRLFQLGYIASRSGHSRGSTVDLTLVDANTCKELDMGSPYDFFGKISHHSAPGISETQKKNRLLLKSMMMKHGFRPYAEEWWHYTYKLETYPDTYFDFPVE
ncbi:M15 family metallopeptidase [Gramella sp. GC03-9]|uniref:D-alanyl-D-alanine dipeptidase n=1 Tax=Christiangramia oceanisediminis TaxID=2920386 RepID=A0A9X2KWR0_9FLAO|nr:M15 family metallopeptidase [Gramella oceanisediminis]MCP9199739.1 M15 family metallopeptidase [Gramella oceanisediminis]